MHDDAKDDQRSLFDEIPANKIFEDYESYSEYKGTQISVEKAKPRLSILE